MASCEVVVRVNVFIWGRAWREDYMIYLSNIKPSFQDETAEMWSWPSQRLRQPSFWGLCLLYSIGGFLYLLSTTTVTMVTLLAQPENPRHLLSIILLSQCWSLPSLYSPHQSPDVQTLSMEYTRCESSQHVTFFLFCLPSYQMPTYSRIPKLCLQVREPKPPWSPSQKLSLCILWCFTPPLPQDFWSSDLFV